MTIKIREGGVYLTREGGEVGPLHRHEDNPVYNWTDGVLFWTESGHFFKDDSKHDLVAEVTVSPSPVRKVTEIVPGMYGPVHVFYVEGTDVRVSVNNCPTPSELRSAASIFTELADALDAMAEEEK